MSAEPASDSAASRPSPLPRPARAAAGGLLAVLLVVGVLAALGGPGPASPQRIDAGAEGEAAELDTSDPPRRSTDPRAARLLQRADEAMRRSHWSGTQFVAAWSRFGERSALLEVEHLPGRGSLVRSSPGRGAVSGLALVPDPPLGTPAGPGRTGPAGTGSVSPRLAALESHYMLLLGGSDRCAGRPAEIVEVWRRGPEGGLAARFWLDEQTGLVLRREVLDARGRIVRASAYVDLDVLPSDDVPTARASEDPSAMTSVSAAPLRDEGWVVPDSLAGLELTSVKATGEGPERIVHLGYTDGLSSVSVFAQSGRLDGDALRGWERHRVGGVPAWVRDGVPQRVAWAAEGTVYTVLADAPPETLDAAVAQLPRSASGGAGSLARSLRERMARGLDRIGSWVEPRS